MAIIIHVDCWMSTIIGNFSLDQTIIGNFPLDRAIIGNFPLDHTIISAWPHIYFRLTTHSFPLDHTQFRLVAQLFPIGLTAQLFRLTAHHFPLDRSTQLKLRLQVTWFSALHDLHISTKKTWMIQIAVAAPHPILLLILVTNYVQEFERSCP